MTQTRKKLVFSWVLILAMVISVISPGSSIVTKAAEAYDGYVYVTVERFTLGQGLAVQPIKIGYHKKDSMEDILKSVYKDKLLYTDSEYGAYMSGFVDDGIPEGWKVDNIPKKIVNYLKGNSITLENVESTGRKAKNELNANDYVLSSYLALVLNNEDADMGISGLTYADKADGSHYSNGSVVRIEFSLCSGADTNSKWATPIIDFPNKDDLIRDIVDYDGDKTGATYKNAVAVLEDWDATEAEVKNAQSALKSAVQVSTIYKDSLQKLKSDLAAPTYGNEWSVLSIARSGNSDATWNKTYVDNVAAQVKAKGTNVLSTTNYATENARVIIGLNAAGGDPTNVGGYNLVEPLADYTLVEKQGLNGLVFALIALDTKNYAVPKLNNSEDVQNSREKLIDGILAKEITGGGWAYSGDKADPDMTGMVLQALAPYYGVTTRVKEPVERGIKVLSDIQDADGGYSSWGAASSYSSAQVVCALSALGINADTDTRFVKNGSSVINALTKYYVENDKAFKGALTDEKSDAYATNQVIYALTSYDLTANKKGRLYMSEDHKHTNVELRGAKEATATTEGYTGDKVCECGELIEKGQAIPATGTTTDESGNAYKVVSTDKDNPTVTYTGTNDSDAKTVTIPDTVVGSDGVTYKVTKIEEGALKNNKKVKTVTVGKNITEIGSNAFSGCTSLNKINVKSKSITSVGASAFKGDTALKSVDFSGSKIKTIGKNAFSGCKKLKALKLNGNSLKTVGKNSFKNLKKNAKITIYAKNKKTYNKVVKLIKKSGAKRVKYAYKKKK